MSSIFRRVFDEIISVLGGDFDKPAHAQTTTPSPSHDLPPLIPPRADGTPDIIAMNGLRINASDCRVCGHALKPGDEQFCSYECEQRLSDSMDAWHDQFESRSGDDDD